MKYTKQYSNETAYNNDTTRVKPNVSLLVEENEVKYNPFSVSGRVAKAGTIVLAEAASPANKIFVPYESWDATTYADYTPIGVVVVPFTHTPDDTVRIMSLKNMDCSNPENGSTATSGNIGTISMYWGGYGSDIPTLTNYTAVPNIDKTTQDGGTVGSKYWVRIPSNYVNGSTFDGGVDSILDPGTKYYESNDDANYGISPYAVYDWKSFEALSLITKSTNAMLDYDGRGNTDKILAVDNSGSTDWQTASTITNTTGDSYVHASAQCCWRYSTVGIAEHGWYLPACGELLYIVPRYADINEALTKLMAADSSKAVRLWRNDPTVQDSSTSVFGTWLWSSTESSSNFARYVDVSGGSVKYDNKGISSTSNRVRAFAALTV